MPFRNSFLFHDFLLPLGIFLIGCILAWITQQWLYCALPIGLYIGLLSIHQPTLLYHIFFFSIPFSIPIYLGAASLELPDEGIAILLTLLSPFILYFNGKNKFPIFLQFPFIIVLISLLWLVLLLFTSHNTALTLKFLFAKIWYIVPMVVLTPIFLNRIQDVNSIFKLFTSATALVLTPILALFMMKGFDFAEANTVVEPFFLNHVAISSFTATSLPLIFYWYQNGSTGIYKPIALYALLLCLIAAISSYTRITWLALFALPFLAIVFKSKTFPTFFFLGIILSCLSIFYLLHHNRYLDFAPNSEQVIYHEGNLERHLEATMEFEDISGIERLYRWIAAKNSIEQHFLFGTGPNTFYNEYKKYTEEAYRTYVSENPEQSTVHNQFLLVFFEQGCIGFLLFAGLCLSLLIGTYRLYHSTSLDTFKSLLLALHLCMWMIIFHISVNDLIETDEIGFLFYFIIGLFLWCRYQIKKNIHSIIVES